MNNPFDHDDDNQESQEYLDNLRMENEIKKIKLSLEHGMDLSDQLSAAELPPKVESELLDYISLFEEQFSSRKMILINDLLGRPELKPVADIPDNEIKDELLRVQQLLTDKSISLETVNPVDDRELYRFITEELIQFETNDIHIEGLIHCYIYEEYYPNHEADVKDACTNFFNKALDKNEEINLSLLGVDNAATNTESTSDIELQIAKLTFLRDAFEGFVINNIAISNVQLLDENTVAALNGTIDYIGAIEKSVDTVAFNGEFKMNLHRRDQVWRIISFEFPGINN